MHVSGQLALGVAQRDSSQRRLLWRRLVTWFSVFAEWRWSGYHVDRARCEDLARLASHRDNGRWRQSSPAGRQTRAA